MCFSIGNAQFCKSSKFAKKKKQLQLLDNFWEMQKETEDSQVLFLTSI